MAELATNSTTEFSRKGDAVLLIAQDNTHRKLTIESMNESALGFFGYEEADVKGRKLEVLLGQQSALVIEEELEYDENAPDLADVLSRYRELRLRLRSGQEVNAPFRLNRLMAEHHQSQFQLILPNDREVTARQKMRNFLKTNLEGHQQLDAITGLPDRATMQATIERIRNFSAENQAQVCVAVIRIDRWQKSVARYGREQSQLLLKHLASQCRSTFRSEDVIAGLGDSLGLILIDLSLESALVVLTRLRWNVSSQMIEFGGKANFSNTISVAFAMLGDESGAEILGRCEEAIIALDPDERNALIEIG